MSIWSHCVNSDWLFCVRLSDVVVVSEVGEVGDAGDGLVRDILSLRLIKLLPSNILIHSLVLSMYSNSFSVKCYYNLVIIFKYVSSSQSSLQNVGGSTQVHVCS
jgi:hypothetical protein